MHACLNVDEIIRHIVCELVQSKAKATAAALAFCRKSFEDPVLDVLWESQDGLLPLLKSLPGDVWNEGRYTVSTLITYIFSFLNRSIQKSFKRHPTALEWARSRKYARKIRALKDSEGLRVLSPEVFSVLQLCAISEPLFPNLKALDLWFIDEKSIQFIPLFLSPRTIIIVIGFALFDSPAATVASMFSAFPILCPNLQEITFSNLPTDPMTAAAVSGMLIANNPNTLRSINVDSPLTEEAYEVIFKLPNLRDLSVMIEDGTPLPSMVLPNLAELAIECDGDSDWLPMFHGATFEKLEAVAFYHESEQMGDFLEAFERVALAASIQHTLSRFYLHTLHSWNPNYSSLLPFTYLKCLKIGFSCSDGCSSRVDDETITNLARTMPKLESLELGNSPCCEIPIGVTVKGLMVLANHCPDLNELQIHFQVASLTTPPEIHETVPHIRSTPMRRDCALRDLDVGQIPMPEESVSIVSLTLARIFPHLELIYHVDENWEKVEGAICISRQIIDYSGKEHHLSIPRSGFSDTSPRSCTRTVTSGETIPGRGTTPTLLRIFHVSLAQRKL